MARSIANTKLQVQMTAQLINTLDDASTTVHNVGGTIINKTLTSGLDTDQANRAYALTGETIVSGATQDLDLYDFAGTDIGAGDGADGVGQAMDIEEIVGLMIYQTAGPGRLEIMPTNPSNYVAWMPAQTVANGGALNSGGVRLWWETNTDALDIEDATSHMLRLKANGGNVTYSLYLFGRSSDTTTTS